MADVQIVGTLGEGGRSAVLDGIWRGRPVALKIFKPRAMLRHARKHALPLARFEFERNLAFHRAPGLAPYVAEPLGYLDASGIQAVVQERLEGELYYFWFKRRGGVVDDALFAEIGRIVSLAHAAGLHDADLHSMNVMLVTGEGGRIWPKLFDFNLIPFHERPRNPLVALALKTGLMDPRSRDLRMLRDFHDFGRVEKKLLRYFERE